MRRSKLQLSRETLVRLDADELAKARGGGSMEQILSLISYTCDPPPPDHTGTP